MTIWGIFVASICVLFTGTLIINFKEINFHCKHLKNSSDLHFNFKSTEILSKKYIYLEMQQPVCESKTIPLSVKQEFCIYKNINKSSLCMVYTISTHRGIKILMILPAFP